MAEQPLPVPLPPFPVDQPVTVHTHQVLEQQLIQEHTQNQKLLTPKSDPHQPPLDDAPPEPLAEPPPEPDEGPKRRRRRRGKRKSQKTGAEPAESEASSHAGEKRLRSECLKDQMEVKQSGLHLVLFALFDVFFGRARYIV